MRWCCSLHMDLEEPHSCSGSVSTVDGHQAAECVMAWGHREAKRSTGHQKTLTQIIILLLLVMAVGCQSCGVDKCLQQYEMKQARDKVPVGPNRAHCALLKDYSECINAYGRSCRGELNFHIQISSVNKLLQNYNCSIILSTPESTPPREEVTKRPQRCSYHGKKDFAVCSVFGDPHIHTFDSQFHTCKVRRAWPLIENPYLAVQVTNQPVGRHSNATGTSKITVIIKESTSCSTEKTYEAQGGEDLPGAFIDGTGGFNDGNSRSRSLRSVYVQEVVPTAQVEITVRYIATTIVIRRVGRFLTFAARLPMELVEESLQRDALELCVSGCPSSERIGRKWWKHGHSDISRDQAQRICRGHGVTDVFFDACVFDLMTTGDASFSSAAKVAQTDLFLLHPARAARLTNRTVLLEQEEDEEVLPSCGPGRPAPDVVFFLLAVTLSWCIRQ